MRSRLIERVKTSERLYATWLIVTLTIRRVYRELSQYGGQAQANAQEFGVGVVVCGCLFRHDKQPPLIGIHCSIIPLFTFTLTLLWCTNTSASQVHCPNLAIIIHHTYTYTHHATSILIAIIRASPAFRASTSLSVFSHGLSPAESMAAITCTSPGLCPTFANVTSR